MKRSLYAESFHKTFVLMGSILLISSRIELTFTDTHCYRSREMAPSRADKFFIYLNRAMILVLIESRALPRRPKWPSVAFGEVIMNPDKPL